MSMAFTEVQPRLFSKASKEDCFCRFVFVGDVAVFFISLLEWASNHRVLDPFRDLEGCDEGLYKRDLRILRHCRQLDARHRS